MVCSDSDEMFNELMTSECSKLAQKKYKDWYNYVWKVIQWKLCKGLKYEYITKWYMYKPESF